MRRLWDHEQAAAPAIGVILMAALVVVIGGGLAVSLLGVAGTTPEPAPTADLEVETLRIDDGVAKNDAIVLTHDGGDQLEREHLEIRVGSDVVFNETADSESNSQTNNVAGLLVEVDDDEFNDLNKPCRLSPPDTCGGPPGDADGSDDSVILQWEQTVQAGQRLVIQERNDPNAYDVIQEGETVQVIYRGDEMTVVLTETIIEG